MNAFVEECRQEWKRLGVPDLLAEEMANELEADLAEAEADGVSASEILGESDPRRFAATWASERGLVPEQAPKKSRKGLWIGLAVGLVLLGAFLILVPAVVVTSGAGSGTVAAQPKRSSVRIMQDGSTVAVQIASVNPVHAANVPHLVGLDNCKAERTALDAGFHVREPTHQSGPPCREIVVRQTPRAGTAPPRHTRHPTVTLRFRPAGG